MSSSTFSGNSSAGDPGGAIAAFEGSALNATDSIFTGNSSRSGGAVYAFDTTATLTNSVFYGNTAPPHENDCYAEAGGSCTFTNEITANPNLSPLGYYGGPTQAMLPLPGSSAICAGVAESGIIADQRGFAIPTTYGGTQCYDVGAVQTHYALAFASSLPSSPVVPGVAMTPAPAVTVTENGTALTAGPATVTVTDADADLTAGSTLSVTTSTAAPTAGQASFSNLLFTGPETGDTLTATLTLNPVLSTPLSLTAASSGFNVGQIAQAITGFNPPASVTYGVAPIVLSATGGASGNPVTFTVSSGPGSIVGSTLTITGAGTIHLAANQAGNAVYSAAAAVSAQIQVSPATLTVSIVGTPSKTCDGTAAATLTAANHQVGGLVSPDSITVSQPVGSYAAATAGPETVTAMLSAANFLAAGQTLLSNYVLPTSASGPSGPGTISEATPVVTWNTPAAITYGTVASALGAVGVKPNSWEPLPV